MSSRQPKRTERVVLILKPEEADALIAVGAALEPWLQRNAAFDTATVKLDEQRTAQGRDVYDNAGDELANQLSGLSEWEFDRLDLDRITKAVVDRILGVYE